MAPPLRLLLLADTHLGFDLPRRPRVERRRRGPDFFANTRAALAPALAGEVDLVVHGGDLLFRSKVGEELVVEALAPFREVAEAGVPVCIVPGNHERSWIPYPLLSRHPRLHVIDRPRTLRLSVAGVEVALSAFPFVAEIGRAFQGVLEATGFEPAGASVTLLCMHQSVEGATVGPSDFTFRPGPEVVSGQALPGGCAAVLSGHIHRAQVLSRDLRGRPLAAPVFYPGSVERTSFAERFEAKGALLLELEPSADGGRVASWRQLPLPTRPMVVLDLDVEVADEALFEAEVRRRLAGLDPDAIVQLRPSGVPGAAARAVLGRVRALAPATMEVEIAGGFWERASGVTSAATSL